MSTGIGIKIIFVDEDASPGDICQECKDPITGKKFTMMLQIGETEWLNFTAFDAKMCEPCYVKTGAKKINNP